MNNDFKTIISKLADDIFPMSVAFRRTLHQNPELSEKEFETTNFIEQTLIENGITTTKMLLLYAQTSMHYH